MTIGTAAETNLIQWVKTNHLLSFLNSLLVLLFSTFVFVLFSENPGWIYCALGLTEKNEALKFLGIGMGGILLAMQAVIANRRAKAMEETAKAQAKATKEQAKANENTERGQRQERLKNAIEHLGHASDSVRLGGAYELFHLAQDTKELRQTVMDILCAHIRRTTGETEYRGKYKSKPSEEVQSLLTLLFVQEHKVFEGCHINLQGSWLNGANLREARLRRANLMETHLQDAKLEEAYLQGARLVQTHLQRANLFGAELVSTVLVRANLQGAYVVQGRLQKARLFEASLQAADFRMAWLQGADLTKTCLQAAEFYLTRLQEASLKGAYLQGVNHRRGDDWSHTPFAERIRESIGKESDLFGVTFAGGLEEQCLGLFVKELPDGAARDLREKLTRHVGKPAIHQLPKNSGAITGAYTEEEAEQWIAEYEKAMAEVPKTAKGQ